MTPAVQAAQAGLYWSLGVLVLVGATSVAHRLDSPLPYVAASVAFALALGWLRGRKGVPRLAPPSDRGRQGAGRLVCLGVVSGYASYPAWVAVIAGMGLALGLDPPSRGGPRWWESWPVVVAGLTAGPVWEELLYRERMLGAFRRAWGTVPAVVLSSAAFALPHAGQGPWALLGTFLVGLALAGVALVGRWIWLCVAIHAGLNLGALAWSFGPDWASLPPGASALAGWAGLGAALWLLRRRAAEPRPAMGRGPLDLEAA